MGSLADYGWLAGGALAAALFVAGVHRSRAPHKALGLGLFLVALLYVLLALLRWDMDWVKLEATGLFLYLLFWRLGLRFGVLWLGVGWLLHPLWDVYVHLIGPGGQIAPRWYVLACVAFDLVVAGYCFWRAWWRGKRRAR